MPLTFNVFQDLEVVLGAWKTCGRRGFGRQLLGRGQGESFRPKSRRPEGLQELGDQRPPPHAGRV
jgi:hypothetical protein